MTGRRVIRRAALAASALVVVWSVWAHAIGAPPDQYAIFNKTDQIITDQKTNLTWQRYQTLGLVQLASVSCPATYRLPTYKELLTLVDEDPHLEWDPTLGKSTLRYIDPNAFPNTPADNFWSLSADSSNSGLPKMVNFGTGKTSSGTTSQQAYVRCVK